MGGPLLFRWVDFLFWIFGHPDPLLAKNVARGSHCLKVLASILEGLASALEVSSDNKIQFPGTTRQKRAPECQDETLFEIR